MEIKLNGKIQNFENGSTVKACVDQFSGQHPHVVVEINREIVPKEEWSRRVIGDGDVIELIGFVGGG